MSEVNEFIVGKGLLPAEKLLLLFKLKVSNVGKGLFKKESCGIINPID
jgi:hypothetical protein